MSTSQLHGHVGHVDGEAPRHARISTLRQWDLLSIHREMEEISDLFLSTCLQNLPAHLLSGTGTPLPAEPLQNSGFFLHSTAQQAVAEHAGCACMRCPPHQVSGTVGEVVYPHPENS